MNRITDFLLIFLVSVLVYACSAMSGNAKDIRDFDKFPSTSLQEETILVNTELTTPVTISIYADSVLLVVNNLNRNPNHVRLFDIERKKMIHDIFPVSRKRGGTLSFMSFDVSDSLVWVFDVAKNGFIVASMDSLLKGYTGVEYYSEYHLMPQVFYYDAALIDRDQGILSGNYDTDEKLVYVNFLDSSLNKELLSYKKDTNIGSSRVNKMSYESFIKLRPDKKKLLLACRYADQFELLDLENGNHSRVRGPVGLFPRLAPYRNNSGVTVATPDEETVYGFLKGHVTQKYFYLLFSGHPVKSTHRFYGNKIFVYDWEGNPVKQINLKNDIVDFTVTSDDKNLYTINPVTKSISFSELKW